MRMVKVTQKQGFNNDVEVALYINIDRIVTMGIDPDDNTTDIDIGDPDSSIGSIIETPEEILKRMKHTEDF